MNAGITLTTPERAGGGVANLTPQNYTMPIAVCQVNSRKRAKKDLQKMVDYLLDNDDTNIIMRA